MDELTLDEAMEDLVAAEDFLEYFEVPFEPQVVHVNRLHILQRFHDYLSADHGMEGLDDDGMSARYRFHLERAYQDFVEAFRPVARAMRGGDADARQCFIARTLMMHEFRRVQLRDPLLPRQLLPADWPGDTARALCREIYAACWRAREAHLMATLETPDGPLRQAGESAQSRFAGLLTAADAA